MNRGVVTRKSRVAKKKISDGEIHFILAVPTFEEDVEKAASFDEAEMRRITRKEASKSLQLRRAG
jgi:hypothetical protein